MNRLNQPYSLPVLEIGTTGCSPEPGCQRNEAIGDIPDISLSQFFFQGLQPLTPTSCTPWHHQILPLKLRFSYAGDLPARHTGYLTEHCFTRSTGKILSIWLKPRVKETDHLTLCALCFGQQTIRMGNWECIWPCFPSLRGKNKIISSKSSMFY